MTYFYRPGEGGMAPSAPRIRYWCERTIKCNPEFTTGAKYFRGLGWDNRYFLMVPEYKIEKMIKRSSWWWVTSSDFSDVFAVADPKFSWFHAVFGKIWQICKLAPPPTENPGSAPDTREIRTQDFVLILFSVYKGVCTLSNSERESEFFEFCLPLSVNSI